MPNISYIQDEMEIHMLRQSWQQIQTEPRGDLGR